MLPLNFRPTLNGTGDFNQTLTWFAIHVAQSLPPYAVTTADRTLESTLRAALSPLSVSPTTKALFRKVAVIESVLSKPCVQLCPHFVHNIWESKIAPGLFNTGTDAVAIAGKSKNDAETTRHETIRRSLNGTSKGPVDDAAPLVFTLTEGDLKVNAK